jgi:hypothetical protein
MTNEPKPIEKPKTPEQNRFVEEDFRGVIFDHTEAEGGPIDLMEGPDDEEE